MSSAPSEVAYSCPKIEVKNGKLTIFELGYTGQSEFDSSTSAVSWSLLAAAIGVAQLPSALLLGVHIAIYGLQAGPIALDRGMMVDTPKGFFPASSEVARQN